MIESHSRRRGQELRNQITEALRKARAGEALIDKNGVQIKVLHDASANIDRLVADADRFETLVRWVEDSPRDFAGMRAVRDKIRELTQLTHGQTRP